MTVDFKPAELLQHFVLETSPQGLQLVYTQEPLFKPLRIDFADGVLAYRLKQVSFKNEPLARALGLKKHPHPRVLDATAGFGRDAAVMAALGCDVKMLEKSPLLGALLEDALLRLGKNSGLNLSLNIIDAVDYLAKLSANERPDIVYLDPMFPEKTKSALVKKEMQILQALVGPDLDSDKLLGLALEKAKQRVIVKRPQYAEPLNGLKPDFVIVSKKHRFDVYLTK